MSKRNSFIRSDDNFYLKHGSSRRASNTQTSMDAFQILGLQRESNFRLKTEPMMKGSSKLNVKEKQNYDTKILTDSNAKNSEKMRKAGVIVMGDKDVWVEKIYHCNENGKTKVVFVSKQTGTEVEAEPPTGASRVVYLRESYRIRKEENCK